ncbi:cryptochrome/deoxyribodipyrimidine photo-lyase family protein [Croceivirga thetidis]|uniref:Deoxyribodipyrimidine photo-lyase n=1 Tax=Croceivirga thetidis TaxID=2721623 RepID=A0ABX1GTL6_9FLAO|nr:deoxyribodipyrimidine photo-lyase [Croceivirga thetidis]NKI32350.1 deoxyribodipyrimidine photo-lyase [Croceivirga thetidis]
MGKDALNIVWLKRDLRLCDHKPLFEAEAAQLPYRIIYIFDSELINRQDCSLRHLQFIYHSISDLNEQLSPFNREVEIFYGKSVEVFKYLISNEPIGTIFSHEETGVQQSWERDKAVAKVFKDSKIKWFEYPTNGIIRGIKNRFEWDKHWADTMKSPLILNNYTQTSIILLEHPFKLPIELLEELKLYPKHFQPAGPKSAVRYLESFFDSRGESYHWAISKPEESRYHCSRLSPYIAWGNISIRQVYQLTKSNLNVQKHKRAFNAFITRLHWHCHFIQKFEVECSYETRCVNSGYEEIQWENNPEYLEAWKQGMTGYPLVDACMRAVNKTGWINFRMRAMLVSFLCHNLDIDWKLGVYHLAQQFLDYEPGIHFPQFQMQAGTTGVNTIRIYNPIKQSMDHDPNGTFIKKWVPELQKVSKEHIHEPWKMTLLEQQFNGIEIGKDYPKPLVDLKSSAKKGREKIWGQRKNTLVQEEKKRILKVHTRRN